jgi:hypothetical protein
LKSLKTSTMGVTVGTIKAHVNLRTDFDAAVNYLRGFISTTDQETRNVSQVETKVPRGKKASKMNPSGKARINVRERDSTSDKSLDRW